MSTTMRKVAIWTVGLLVAGVLAGASGAEEMAVSVSRSGAFRMDAREGTRIVASGEAEQVAVSGRWEGSAATASADGAVLASVGAGEETVAEWVPDGAGYHVLRHESGGVVMEAGFTLLGTNVVVHAGSVAGSETWEAGKVHLVDGMVTVGSEASLTIESGAVVKFMDGTGLLVASGGSCSANGVIFTHVADDTAGGDTMGDRNETVPVSDRYSVTGSVTMDAGTELRYLTVKTSGTLNTDTVWRGNGVIRVTGNLTVASGATLSVMPGAVVKFAPGVSLTVNSGGTLNAIGTRAQPIVFTSVKDDEHGGDTNGDGDATAAQPGDWSYLRIRGTGAFDYCSVLYASSYENYGGVEAYGGTVTFDNGEIAHMKWDSVNAHSSGTFTLRNTAIWDGSLGFGYYGSGRVKAYNCVFQGLTTAVRQSGKLLVNCVLANCLAFTDQSGDGSTFDHCVFWNPAGYDVQSYYKVGQSGNKWGDPLFVDAENGDFRVRAGSVCIDAGDGSVAPETDYFGRPRMNDPNVADTGVANADGVCPDIGIYEMEGGNAASDVDLEAVRAGASAEEEVGGTLSVEWTVANAGTEKAAGPWRDVLSLVNEATGETVDLGEAVSAGGLAGKASKEWSGRFTVPAVSEGDWRVKVQVNAYRDVYEGGAVTNNVALSAGTVRIGVAGLKEDGTASGMAGAGVPWTTKVVVPEEGRWMLQVEAPAGSVVRYGVGFVPGEGNASGKATVGADGMALVSLAAGTTVYVTLEGKGTVNVRLLDAALAVSGVSPAELPGSGTTTLTVKGANFEDGAVVSVGDVAAVATEWLNAETLVAKVDCAALPTGACAVEVAQGEEKASLVGAVMVNRKAGEADLKAWLEVPESVRQGRVVTIYVNYENVGNLDMPAPVLGLTATGLVFRVDGNEYTNRVNLLGLSAEAPVGTLRPGEKQRVAVEALVAEVTRVYSWRWGWRTSVQYSLTSRWAGQKGAEEEIRAGQFFDPAWVWRQGKEADGAAKVEALRDAVGRTWSEFFNRLGAFASATRDENVGATVYEEVASEYVESVYWNECAPEPGGIGELDDSDDGSVEEEEAEPSSITRGKKASATTLTGTTFASDNSIDGDVWCWTGNGWTLLYSDQEDVKINGVSTRRAGLVGTPNGASLDTSVFNPARGSVMICHGMRNSIHEKWIEKMARALKAKHKGTHNILAVDWGEGATKWLPQTASKNIDDTAVLAYHRLRDAGVKASTLTLIGHSHGGHLAGRLSSKLKGVKRLIGLDVSTSDLFVHWHDGANYWLNGQAKQKLFYKSSWNLSLASDGRSEMNADFNFALYADNDFYEQTFLNDTETERHSRAYTWFTKTIVPNSKFNWGYNFEDTAANHPQWTAQTGLERHPGTGAFAGVINASWQRLECATRPAGTAEDDWLFGENLVGQRNIDDLHENTLRVVDYVGTGISAQAKTDKGTEVGVLVTGGRSGNTVKLAYRNRANNTSIPWNHLNALKSIRATVEDNTKYLPWNGWDALENSLWLARVSDIENGESLASRLKTDKTLSAAEIDSIWNVARKIARSASNQENFAKPGTSVSETFADVVVDPWLFNTRLGCDDAGNPLPEGEKCILVGLAGENDDDKVVYKYDLASRSNNFCAVAVTVYDGELGIPVVRKAGGGRTTARAGDDDWLSEVVIDVDATKEGAWSVTLDGSKSIFPHGSSAQYWWFDWNGEVVSRNVTATFRGTLPEGEDYDEKMVWLAVSEAEGAKWAECTLRITREPDEPDEEDEDEKGSNVPISCDPNEMGGPDGVKMVEEGGTNRYVQAGREMEYSIYFENKADATAAAQEVRVVNPLSEWLDWGTFEMGEVVFHNQVDRGLAGKASGTSETALEGAGEGWKVKSTLAVSTNGVAEWYLRVVDESTADGWPVDPYAGFLPPNDAEGNGEGRLTYKIRVREDAPIGVVISNSAVITFDYNAPIETDPAWWNIVEAVTNVTLEGGAAEGTRAGDGGVEVVAGKPFGDLLPTPERTGWTFGGWWTGENGTGTQVTAETIAGIDTLTLFAKWVQEVLAELWLDMTQGRVLVGADGVTDGFVLETATEVKNGDWNWREAQDGESSFDVERGAVEWTGDTQGVRVFRFRFPEGE